MNNEERTQQFNKLAVEYSRYYKGKIRNYPNVPISSVNDFSYWYTPGVAEVSRVINKSPDESFELTGRWNSIGIITDGTRVLGLGNVGPEAAMPVMEGKAMIFNLFGGVNAVPLPMRVSSGEEFIKVAMALEPSFGGYNLEDIESPKCFFVLRELQEKLSIPAWHDDQLGTACIILAGLINSLRIAGKKIPDTTVSLIGSGAANIAAAHLMIEAGFKPGNIIMVDSKGILEPERTDLDKIMISNPWKYELALKTNEERRKGDIEESMEGVDIVVSAAKSQPGLIKPEWVRKMNRDPAIFALANPLPEIWPDDAKSAGAKVVATGRSDFPNQINNSLVFPGIFRGVLDARSRGVNFRIMVKAAYEIADYVKNPDPDHIVPTMGDWELYPRVASSVARATVEEKLARKVNSKEGFYKTASEIITLNRENFEKMMKLNIVEKLPEVNE
ncbi:NAD(P)-dependent malic enzyme [Cuniculiplasma divulgatum]|jgi:malate dehydrogenase (oxaloacetate-decarboxylating)|uniref:Malate dehydrogenase (Oxaloacetate-decarboxylating) n=1 Tax=Cuniculiplasma divulgatum TaxID=1673428 RepID=A0A1N5U7K4_9ARCH|nr:NADP-dependent malic enzyme [Cuniculiplasma divulgatum]MCL4320920.1 NADP-dependent malic enzyme [Candidatus Thermoplasmatota archaeon]SIM56823.1 malate dehydrogenase (oxaloacetate-decarboxylating) [Cuniculiplasma divulgatum]SJK84682.1 malate dehydrogenase (oxaloacetate-decarboxylating) [Cuniculiplasma divulgatum]